MTRDRELLASRVAKDADGEEAQRRCVRELREEMITRNITTYYLDARWDSMDRETTYSAWRK